MRVIRAFADRAIASDRFARVASGCLCAAKAGLGSAAALRLLERFSGRLVWSGWPRYTPGWTNLHASELYWRLRRQLEQPAVSQPRRTRADAHGACRIGCVGAFRGLLSFQKELFERRLGGTEIYLYDLQYRGRFAGFLESLVAAYRPVLESSASTIDEWALALAERINADELDVLLNVNPKPVMYKVVDAIDTPCVVNICTGSELLHHEKVSFQVYAQPEAGYRQQDGRLVSEASNKPVGDHQVFAGWILYDSRGLEHIAPRAWAERQPLIVYHGSLYKLNTDPVLRLLVRLLRDDSALDFVFMGTDRWNALRAITTRFTNEGLANRVHFEGAFSPVRDEEGNVSDPGWTKLVSYLQQARLAPDPWPIGGGSARVEAYLSGVPSVHMALAGPDDTGHERALIDLPALHVGAGTAMSPDDYDAVCRKCLYDANFATALVGEQLAVARRVTDPGLYWQQLRHYYDQWRAAEARSRTLP